MVEIAIWSLRDVSQWRLSGAEVKDSSGGRIQRKASGPRLAFCFIDKSSDGAWTTLSRNNKT